MAHIRKSYNDLEEKLREEKQTYYDKVRGHIEKYKMRSDSARRMGNNRSGTYDFADLDDLQAGYIQGSTAVGNRFPDG